MSGLRSNRQQRRMLAADNRAEPSLLRPVPPSEWPDYRPPGLEAVWRSREFLVQVFTHESAFRLSVCRTQITGARWTDGISWDDLQRVKRECGLGDKCAVELFPPDGEVVNVANMRHLWIVDAPPFMWRAQAEHDPAHAQPGSESA